MGFTPQQVNAMSPWEWAAAVEGYLDANTDPKERGATLMSDEEFAAAERMLEG